MQTCHTITLGQYIIIERNMVAKIKLEKTYYQ